MSTAALQLKVQRHRFALHAFAAFAAKLPPPLRSLILGSASADARPATSESPAMAAEAVREMARAYQRTDPGFAADLFAAAARHEGPTAD